MHRRVGPGWLAGSTQRAAPCKPPGHIIAARHPARLDPGGCGNRPSRPGWSYRPAGAARPGWPCRVALVVAGPTGCCRSGPVVACSQSQVFGGVCPSWAGR